MGSLWSLEGVTVGCKRLISVRESQKAILDDLACVSNTDWDLQGEFPIYDTFHVVEWGGGVPVNIFKYDKNKTEIS
jgi:hypothetical protein